jgi:hypothetical protein
VALAASRILEPVKTSAGAFAFRRSPGTSDSTTGPENELSASNAGADQS